MKNLLLFIVILFLCSCYKEEEQVEGWTCYGYQDAQGEVESFLGTQSEAGRFEVTLNQRGGNWECRKD